MKAHACFTWEYTVFYLCCSVFSSSLYWIGMLTDGSLLYGKSEPSYKKSGPPHLGWRSPGWPKLRVVKIANSVVAMLFFFFLFWSLTFYCFNLLPPIRSQLPGKVSLIGGLQKLLRKALCDWKAVFTYLQDTILGNTLLHWMRVGLKKRRNGLLN